MEFFIHLFHHHAFIHSFIIIHLFDGISRSFHQAHSSVFDASKAADVATDVAVVTKELSSPTSLSRRLQQLQQTPISPSSSLSSPSRRSIPSFAHSPRASSVGPFNSGTKQRGTAASPRPLRRHSSYSTSTSSPLVLSENEKYQHYLAKAAVANKLHVAKQRRERLRLLREAKQREENLKKTIRTGLILREKRAAERVREFRSHCRRRDSLEHRQLARVRVGFFLTRRLLGLI